MKLSKRTRSLPKWYGGVLGGLVVEVFFLIALGGSVRIMNAGLACPDWPLCFGDYIPDYHPQVYFEFIHRAMAGLVAITTVVLTYFMWVSDVPRRFKLWISASLVLLLAQIIFGGLTVLLQLQAGVVAAHLALGTAFFAVLLWIYLGLKYEKGLKLQASLKPPPARMAAFMIAVIYGQILLGGLVASNYAALVCLDFPTCQGQWFPTFQGMIGLHVIHRLGAYFVFLAVFVNWLWIKRTKAPKQVQRLASAIFFGVGFQICLGIANVLLRTPALIGVLHLATAVFVLSLAIRMLYFASRSEVL